MTSCLDSYVHLEAKLYVTIFSISKHVIHFYNICQNYYYFLFLVDSLILCGLIIMLKELNFRLSFSGELKVFCKDKNRVASEESCKIEIT